MAAGKVTRFLIGTKPNGLVWTTRLKAIVLSYPMAPLEIVSSVAGICIGGRLLFANTVIPLGVGAALDGVMPQKVWGLLFFIVGICQFVGCVTTRAKTRIVGAYTLLMLLSFLWGLCLAKAPEALSFALSLPLVLAVLWLCVRSSFTNGSPFMPKRGGDFE